MTEAVPTSRAETKRSRRQDILEALASELEQRPGERITTAKLAASLGAVSYTHLTLPTILRV